MSVCPGPDHPATTMNADELVAVTTEQPLRPQGYLRSGATEMEGLCV